MAKVIIGMSGGVDSAVAAVLLKKAGYDVIGITLRTWISEDGQESRCCEIDDARRAAWKIGIPYYALNCLSEFQNAVTEPFVNDYLQGLTPNPCIVCNRDVKWEKMLYFAKVMKADFIATGHYASVIRLENGRYTIEEAVHSKKDQSYMLYALTQEQLAATLMPLGRFTKQEVRKIAAEEELPVAEKADSQEICFVMDGSYAAYIQDHAKTDVPGEGCFVDEDGNVLGTHKGIFCYTVGQRRGLGLPLGYPAYVKRINPERNEVVVGKEESLYSREIICRDLNFLSIHGLEEKEQLRCTVKVRYHHKAQAARIEQLGQERVRVLFDDPVRAAAPGQSAVFYDENNRVIGGGIISEVVSGNE